MRHPRRCSSTRSPRRCPAASCAGRAASRRTARCWRRSTRAARRRSRSTTRRCRTTCSRRRLARCGRRAVAPVDSGPRRSSSLLSPRPRARSATVQYMLLIHDDPSAWAGMSEEQVNAVMGEYFAYSAAIRDEGIFVDGNALQGREEARTVSVRDGERLVKDGPFAETKETRRRLLRRRLRHARPGHRRRRAHPERPLRRGRGAPRRADVSTPPPLQREAIGWLYREWFGRAVGVLARSVGDLDLAEECVQDAFATAVERWPRDGCRTIRAPGSSARRATARSTACAGAAWRPSASARPSSSRRCGARSSPSATRPSPTSGSG